MPSSNPFYASLTPFYHLIYADWHASIQYQAKQLDSVVREAWGEATTILDVSCGIGTQAIGLAKLGYEVTASDLSPEEIERAQQEARKRNLSIDFSVADMRSVHDHHQAEFDIVLSADNAVAHLLSDDEILAAFRQFHACLRDGGGCIISVRDYDKEDLSRQQIKPYGIREEGGVRWLAWQVWDPHPPTYDVTMYFIEDRGDGDCRAHSMQSTYYAIGTNRLQELMREAGFNHVKRLDDRFFQPLIIGTKT